MKKILSVLLASLLLLSTSATAFAMETETNADNWLVSANQHQIIHNAKIAAETGQNVTLTTKILSDLSDNHFELVEVGDTGYMIFDPQSGKYLEEALDSPSPYLGLSENLYYFGPLNYYQLSGDKFVHTVIHNEYDMSFAECRSLQSAFDTALQNSRTQKDTEVLALMQTNLNSRASVNRLQSHFSARVTNKYIPNYKYIKNAIYPANENNTCGYTAACLILNYWHKVKGNVMVWLQSRHIRRWFSRFKYTVCIKLKKEVKYEESLYIFSRNGNYIWNFWLWKERIYCFSFFCIRCCEN